MKHDLRLLYLTMLLGKCKVKQAQNLCKIEYELNCGKSLTKGRFTYDADNCIISEHKEVMEWFMNKFLAR